MSLYGRIFAWGYDWFLSGSERAGLADQRRRLVAEAEGRVVEIGAGTGLNLPHYPSAVSELVLTEPEAPMATRLERRLEELRKEGRVVLSPAESLSLEDDSFDTAVGTLVLCTVEDVDRALSEVRRVLRPGGKFLFLEHVRSDQPRLAKWQDRLHPLWLRFGHGCNCNRRTQAAIEASGFQVERVEHGEIPKSPPIVRPLIIGRAVAA